MITVTPIIHNQLVIAVRGGYGGSAIPSAEEFAQSYKDIFSMKAGDFPTQSTIGQFANDPVIAVEYFLEISNYIFEHVLGWDMKAKKSKVGGGILGELSAYTAGIEAQGNTLLHWHALGWIKGFPKTQTEEEERYDKAGTLRSDLAKYLDAINTTTLPIYDLFEEPFHKPAIVVPDGLPQSATQSSSSTDMEVDNDEPIETVQKSTVPTHSSSSTDMDVVNDEPIETVQDDSTGRVH
jgi:hypothetical protein